MITSCLTFEYSNGINVNPLHRIVSNAIVSVHTWFCQMTSLMASHLRLVPSVVSLALQWRHNGCDGVSNHQPYDGLLNRSYRRRSKKTSKLCVAGLCTGNSPVTSPVTGEFPTQMASNAENVSSWWRHHGILRLDVDANGFYIIISMRF